MTAISARPTATPDPFSVCTSRPSCRPARRGSVHSSAAPGNPGNSSRRRFRDTSPAPAARPPDRGCGWMRTRYRRCKAAPADRVRPKLLQHRLGRAGHPLVLVRAVVRVRDADHFDLAKLVLAQHAARVAPGRPGLAAETVGQCGQADRQLLSPPGSRRRRCWSAAPRRSGSDSGRRWS